MTQILNARAEERKIKTEIKKVTGDKNRLEEEIDYAERNLQNQVEELRDKYVEEKHEEIKEKYEPRKEELEEEIQKLESNLDSKDVEDTEELVQARETKEYLNTAAIVVNRYYEELKKVSSPYFIDLAYNEKSMKLGAFKKAFSSLPKRVRDLEHLRTDLTQPFRFVETQTEKRNANFGSYFTGSVMSWWVAACTPLAIIKSVKRAKYLHESASLYHKLMHTLASLSKKTDEEIAQIFSSLLQLKGQKLLEELEEKRQELESLEFDLQEELRSVEFDESSFLRTENMKIANNRVKLQSLTDQLERLEYTLEDILALLEKLTGERTDSLEIERDTYLRAREDREVVLPFKLLYDWTPDSNAFFELKHGLYLFSDRSTVADFLQMMVFQLRNIMEWGSIQFKVLDLLGAEFMAPLMLPNTGKAKAQDISIFSLREEREQLIELMHDLLVRRKLQILQSVTNLGDYNLIQKAAGSSPTPYQIIFIILDSALKPDEKLVQLIHSGENLGLLVFIFMKDELLTVQLAKSIETYFNSFAELSESGITSYEPEEYRMLLEQKEADQKSRI